MEDPENEFSFNDDGEPSGSAGQPILQTLAGAGLSGTVAVVTRYFGGVKLGVGGLARAYSEAAAAALELAGVREGMRARVLALSFDYPLFGRINQVLESEPAAILDRNFGQSVGLNIAVSRSREKALVIALTEAVSARIEIEVRETRVVFSRRGLLKENEMKELNQEYSLTDPPSILPLFLLEDRVVLPGLVVPVAVTAGCLSELSGLGLCNGSLLVFACPPPEGHPAAEKSLCSSAGVLGRVVRFIRMGDSSGRLLVQGERRVCLDEIQTQGRLTLCRANEVKLPEPEKSHAEQVLSRLHSLLDNLVEKEPDLARELSEAAGLFHCPGQLADFAAANLPLSLGDRRALVDMFDPVQRAEMLIAMVLEGGSEPARTA